MNFQNIPRGDKVIKRGFLPKYDYLSFFDYAQIEYRLLAFYLAEQLGETRMAQAFKEGLDPHTVTAKIILDAVGIEYEEPLTDYLRQVGKTGNFSIVYAGGTPTIIRQLTRAGWTCDYKLAKQILDAIQAEMPEVARLENAIYETLDDRGYIMTLWGRHLRPNLDKYDRRGAYRKMLNALIQGCAADLMRHALREIDKGLRENDCQSHLVNNVHDEVQIDTVESELDFLAEMVPQWMDYEEVSNVVPILAEMEISDGSWADQHSYAERQL